MTGQVVYLPLAEQSDLDKVKGTLAGKIVLLGTMRKTPDVTEPLFHRYTDAELKEMETAEAPAENRTINGQTRAQYLAARLKLSQLREAALKMMTEEGVAAVITPSRDSENGGGTGIIFDDNGANLVRGAQDPAKAVKVPNAVMMIEHYNRLARMVTAHVPVTVEVNIDTRFTGDHEHGFNTVAEIPGTDPQLKDEVVMVVFFFYFWLSS